MLLFFGGRLKQLRTAKGLSQDDLAEKLGVKKATISSYEKDKTSPSLEVFIKICAFFQVSADYLSELDENPKHDATGLTDNQNAIINSLIEEFLRTNRIKEK